MYSTISQVFITTDVGVIYTPIILPAHHSWLFDVQESVYMFAVWWGSKCVWGKKLLSGLCLGFYVSLNISMYGLLWIITTHGADCVLVWDYFSSPAHMGMDNLEGFKICSLICVNGQIVFGL